MIVNGFWYGKAVPLHVVACMTSFLRHGHHYRLYSYDRLEVPNGVEICDAREILSEHEIFMDVKPDGGRTIAAFSDLFRYALLYQRGGWWVDTDVVCVRHELPEAELYFAREDAEYINGAILRTPARHPFVELLQQKARMMGRSPKWGNIGPRLVTEVAQELNLSRFAAPKEEAYPIYWEDFADLVTASAKKRVLSLVQNAYFVHVWNEMFSGDKRILLQAPEWGSYISDIYADYLSPIQNLTIHGRRLNKIFRKIVSQR